MNVGISVTMYGIIRLVSRIPNTTSRPHQRKRAKLKAVIVLVITVPETVSTSSVIVLRKYFQKG
jgi:hypothetical protein